MPCQEAMSTTSSQRSWHINDPLSLLEPGSQGPVQVLLTKVSTAWMHANRDEALRSCYDAMHCANRTNDLACSALAQLYLANTCARLGHSTEGADWARRAARRFRLLGNSHNAMIAHLLLARLECALHSLDTAQINYQKALDICRKLQSREKAAARRKAALYEQIAEEIQDAIAEVTSTVTEVFDETFHLESIPILYVSDGPDQALVERSGVVRYAATTGEFLVEGRTYRPYPIGEASDRKVDLKAGDFDFALIIPEDGWLGSDGRAGDYALVRRESRVTQEGPGVLWTGDHWVGGRFERDATTGDIDFVSSQPHIIGKEQGCVVALLKLTA
jgi:tetratricopeptide (TPR) repeat protein